MFNMKFLDGTPVDKNYAAKIGALVAGACNATDHCTEDELEEFAEVQRRAATLPAFLPYDAMSSEQKQAFDARQGINPAQRERYSAN